MKIKEDMLITKYDLLFESRISKAEESLIHLDKKIDRLDKNLSDVKMQMNSNFRWLFGLIVGLGAVMAKGFHWY
jgi:hypothetical protein